MGTQNAGQGQQLFANIKHVEGIGVRGKKWHNRKTGGRGGPQTEGLKEKEKQKHKV
jgi:hypothetical protein